MFVVTPDIAGVGLDLESADKLPDFLPSSRAASLDDDTLKPSDRALHTLLATDHEPFDGGEDFGTGVLGLQLSEICFRLV